MQENDSWRNVIPRKVNDTCVKTMHAGMMDRGFTVSERAVKLLNWYILIFFII
jgi:hypothetical protein